MSKIKDLKFEVAPQEAIKFNEMIIDYLIVKLFNIKEFMVTDESMLSDFMLFTDANCEQQSDGSWVSKNRLKDKEKLMADFGSLFFGNVPKEMRKEYLKDVPVDDEDVTRIGDVLNTITEVFGVTLPEASLKKHLPEVAVEISQQISSKKRQELTANYSSLFS